MARIECLSGCVSLRNTHTHTLTHIGRLAIMSFSCNRARTTLLQNRSAFCGFCFREDHKRIIVKIIKRETKNKKLKMGARKREKWYQKKKLVSNGFTILSRQIIKTIVKVKTRLWRIRFTIFFYFLFLVVCKLCCVILCQMMTQQILNGFLASLSGVGPLFMTPNQKPNLEHTIWKYFQIKFDDEKRPNVCARCRLCAQTK